MEGIRLRSSRVFLWTRNFQIHNYRLLPAAHDHCFHGLVLFRVQFLVRHIRRHVHEVSRTGLVHKLQSLSPPEARPTAYNINHRLKFSVMMWPGLGIRMHEHCPGPKFLRPNASPGNSFSPLHSRSLGRVAVQFAAANDSQADSFYHARQPARLWKCIAAPASTGCVLLSRMVGNLVF